MQRCLNNILTEKKIFSQLGEFVSVTFITASFKQVLFSNHKVVKTTFSIQ